MSVYILWIHSTLVNLMFAYYFTSAEIYDTGDSVTSIYLFT